MGNYLAIELLRQMAIRDRGLPPKIRDVMMAAPDIDIDVFRRQIAEIDAGPRPTYFTLFVSRDDRALSIVELSRPRFDPPRRARPDQRSLTGRFWRKAECKSSTSPTSHPADFTNHSKFASGEVVGAIGERLAEGQTLNEAKPA